MPLRHYKLPKQLSRNGWRALFREWAKLMDKYEGICREEDGADFAYWYGERALTGFLAAAAWRLDGGWSLEEFLGFRGSRGSKRAGRGDAWIRARRRWYTIEAKQLFVGRTPTIKRIKEKLAEAENQLRKLREDFTKGTRLLATCYVILDFSAESPKRWKKMDKSISGEIWQQFAEEERMSVVDYRPLGEPGVYEYKGTKRVCPGIILIGRLVTRARR